MSIRLSASIGLVLLLWSLLITNTCFAQEAGATASPINLAATIEYLEDPKSELTIEDLARSEVAARFRPWDPALGQVNFGFTHSSYWLRLSLKRAINDADDWMLEIPYLQIQNIDFYAPDRAVVTTGSGQSFSTRPVFHRFFVFPVKLSTLPQQFYFRVASSYALAVPLDAWQLQPFLSDTQQLDFVQGIYYGGLLAFLMYNLILSFKLRDRRFLLYSLFTGIFGMGMLAGNGFGMMFLWPNWPMFNDVAQSFFLGISGAFAVLFTRDFLGTAYNSALLDRLLKISCLIFCGVSLLLAGSVLWGWSTGMGHQILMLNTIPTGLLIVVAGVVSLRNGHSGARLFLLAWGSLWLGAAVATLRAFSIIPTNAITSYALQLSSSVEILLLALALADIVRQERVAKERVQSALIVANQAEFKLRKGKEISEHALTEQSRFTAMLTHELKTPLSVLRMALGIINVKGSVKIYVNRALDDMNIIIERASQVDLLEQHQLEVRPEPCHIDDILLSMKSNSWAPNRVFVTTEPLPIVYCDLQLLRIILGNLISNAIKYSATETGIEISAAPSEKLGKLGILILIQNQVGPSGLPDPERLFDKYYRGTGAYSKTGSGLGLYLVRSITQLLGGQVAYDVVHAVVHGVVQEKVRFTLWLPC